MHAWVRVEVRQMAELSPVRQRMKFVIYDKSRLVKCEPMRGRGAYKQELRVRLMSAARGLRFAVAQSFLRAVPADI